MGEVERQDGDIREKAKEWRGRNTHERMASVCWIEIEFMENS